MLSVLGLITGFVFIGCWVWGVGNVLARTKNRREVRRFFWVAGAIFLPLGGWLLFAFSRKARGERAVKGYAPVAWMPASLHLGCLVLGFVGLALSRSAAVLHVEGRAWHDYHQEWWFSQQQQPPELCLAMSGGGIRSAAFNVGVLHGLHDAGLLKRIGVMSAVSGGSYALSWFLLQQYYAGRAGGLGMDREKLLNWMFDPKGNAQRHLALAARQLGATDTADYYLLAALSGVNNAVGFNLVRAISWISEDENRANAAGMARGEYRASLQRTFQQLVHPETGAILNGYRPSVTETAANMDLSFVTKVHFLDLAQFAQANSLPFFIFNTTVVTDPSHHAQRASDARLLWPEVFELNGWGMGTDSYGYSAWPELEDRGPRFEAVRLVNVAPAISGAALTPVAMERYSGGRIALTVGNVDLGYLIPRFKKGDRGSLFLTDGGHSENLGLYSLVRRSCQNIIVVDAEEELSEPYQFSSYKVVKAALEREMNLDFAIPAIDSATYGHGNAVLSGTIKPIGPSTREAGMAARVVYIKLAMDKLRRDAYPISLSDPSLGQAFPQDPTTNQNFSPAQYEAYRDLGYWMVGRSSALRGMQQALKPPN